MIAMLRILRTCFGCVAILLGTAGAYAAVLSAGSVSGLPGKTGVVVPISLTSPSSESVAAMQFDIPFNTAVFHLAGVSAGDAAHNAGKQVAYSTPATGQVRIIVSGFNQTRIENGTVANVTFDILENAAEATYPIALTQAILSDPQGRKISTQILSGSFLVGLPPKNHSADTDLNWSISLTELLRVIQFFNYRGYYCSAGTEDGYAPGTGAQSCIDHDSDYYPAPNWSIELFELLRLIQLFNFGQYHVDAAGEDGFAPGADSKIAPALRNTRMESSIP